MYAIIFFLCIVKAAYAEPSLSVRYLINEPVSLLDWGTYFLKKDLENSIKQTDSAPAVRFVDVDYDYEKNMIILQIRYHIKTGELSHVVIKDFCRSLLNTVRLEMYVDPKTGKLQFPTLKQSKVSEYFFHNGYHDANQPETLASDIDRITNIDVGVWRGNEFVNCKGELMGSDIYYMGSEK